MLAAWGIEFICGWPSWLFQRIRHPVVWFGALVSVFDQVLNQPRWSHPLRYVSGLVSTLILVAAATGAAISIARLFPDTVGGVAIEAVIASSLIASRSLYTHVSAVARPLLHSDLPTAREAVSLIVGRDPSQLDEAGIARASLESLSENASDGVIAPLFWGAIFGLPGLAAYKAINTLDSMIGQRTDRYHAFGGFAARLDDLVNLVPARLTSALIALASLSFTALKIILRDARYHRSPNAGWPEAAMAGALDVRLSGPRTYGHDLSDEPWLNGNRPDPSGADIAIGLKLYRRAMICAALVLGITVIGQTL